MSIEILALELPDVMGTYRHLSHILSVCPSQSGIMSKQLYSYDHAVFAALWLWSYLAQFLRYGDLLAKNCLFFILLSHSAPPLPMIPSEFRAEVKHEEARVRGLVEVDFRCAFSFVLLS